MESTFQRNEEEVIVASGSDDNIVEAKTFQKTAVKWLGPMLAAHGFDSRKEVSYAARFERSARGGVDLELYLERRKGPVDPLFGTYAHVSMRLKPTLEPSYRKLARYHPEMIAGRAAMERWLSINAAIDGSTPWRKANGRSAYHVYGCDFVEDSLDDWVRKGCIIPTMTIVYLLYYERDWGLWANHLNELMSEVVPILERVGGPLFPRTELLRWTKEA